MSDYPVAPAYGAGYSSRNQNNPPYVPPYSNPYMQGNVTAQGHMGTNYDASISAYGYNQSVPAFPTPNLATGVPPLPIYQGWNQESLSLHPYSAPPNQTPYQGYVQNAQAQQGAQYYPQVSQPSYQQNMAPVQRYEQADLSEGEFEDGNATRTPVNYNESPWGALGGNGYSDTAQHAFHNRNQDHNVQPAPHTDNGYPSRSRDTSQIRRQQSDSYSPYGADEQPRYKSAAPSQVKQPPIEAPKKQNGVTQNGTINQTNGSHLNGNHTNGWHKEKEENNHVVQTALQAITQNTASQHQTLKGRSIPEMRNEAGKAVRELFPRGVRYSTYLEEGFKEDIISNLFDDVKIPKTGVTHAKADVEHTSPATANLNQTDYATQDAGMVGAKKPVIASGALSVSETAISLGKSIAMDEKQKTLQSKMEALRKSREERAQKAAAKNPVKPTTLSASTPSVPTPEAPTSIAAPEGEPSKLEDVSTILKSPLQSVDDPITLPVNPNKDSSTHSAPPVANTQSQIPLIPGLFLASNAVTPALAPTPPPTAQAPTVNQRKRPVASDFDEPAPSIAPFRRPFGHSQNEQPLVINVSEDESEDEDVAMELESQADQDSPVQPGRKMSDQRSASLQSLQSSNLPNRKPYTPPPNAIGANTPPRPQSGSKTPLPTPDVLLQKETEIQKLKKIIAEREAARARARQTPSGSGAHTPRASEVEVTTSKDALTAANSTSTSKVDTSIQVQKLITVADEKVALDQQRLIDTQAAEAQKAAEVAQNEAEQKRLRRQKITSDLPLVEAEVIKGQSKLEELRAEMARIQADIQQKSEEKRKLSEELARLGQEADDQLQAEKTRLNDLHRQDASNNIGTSHVSSPTAAAEPKQPSLDIQEVPLPITESIAPRSTPIDIPGNKEPDLPSNPPVTDTNHVDELSNAFSSSAMEEERDDSSHSISTDRALEAQLQEAVQAQADHDDTENDMEVDIPAPESNHEVQGLSSSPPEEGQISDDYSPVLERAMPDVDAADRESDDYEPPDATPPDDVSEVDSPPFSPAPPETVPELHGDNMIVDSIQAADTSGQKDDSEAKHHDNGALLQVIENDIHETSKTQFFTPYESPLKKFRAYRFHPEFKRDVAGGLRSLTYSHKIDPNVEFCRYELAGGICNDASCVEQHFRDIKIADDHIMAAIGCPDEFQGEQRDKFRDSLREVLMGLRVRKVKDFDTISSEIISHRAKFLGDPSKILATLEGTTL